MGEEAERFERVARGFDARVEGVGDGGWEMPAPCEGWVARDVVAHLVEWVPGLLAAHAGVDLAVTARVDDDPAGAWRQLRDGLAGLLADEGQAGREVVTPAGTMTLAQAVDRLVTGDVLVHTWDLARATGQDEALAADEVARMYEGVLPMDAALRSSGHFGPAVAVDDGADTQTRLLAFLGRRV